MNLLSEIGRFLIPGLDALQLFFFSLMLLAVVVTMRSVKRNAKEEKWQLNWERCGLDATSAELGSAAERSQSVETKAEKVAAIMPGMLLILGLLGTFLGLGLALDKASGILQNSGNSIGALDGSMHDLMEMMQGLGTKFKTSTWGIIAFIFLKTWESWNGFEERRLNWCLSMLQQVIREGRAHEKEDTLQYRQQQDQGRVTSTESIVNALAQQTQALREEFIQQAKRAESVDAQRHQHHLAALNDIAEINTQSRNLLETYTENSEKNLNALQQAATTMSNASQKVSRSAESLESVVSTLGSDLGAVMNDIKRELSQVVSEMNADFTRNVQQMSEMLASSTGQLSVTMQQIESSLNVTISGMSQEFSGNMTTMAAQLDRATSQISESVNNMSARIDTTMMEVSEKTEKASQIQRRAMEEFSDTSATLNEQVLSMTRFIERVTEAIKSGLMAVSEGNRKLEFYFKRFNEAFDALNKLPLVVGNMTDKLTTLCEQLDQQMPELRTERQAALSAVMDMQSKMTALLSEAQQFRLQPEPALTEA